MLEDEIERARRGVLERSSPRTQRCARLAGKWTESPEFDEDDDCGSCRRSPIEARHIGEVVDVTVLLDTAVRLEDDGAHAGAMDALLLSLGLSRFSG